MITSPPSKYAPRFAFSVNKNNNNPPSGGRNGTRGKRSKWVGRKKHQREGERERRRGRQRSRSNSDCVNPVGKSLKRALRLALLRCDHLPCGGS